MPVFLPGEFHGQRSLAGYSPWVAKSWIQLSVTHLGTKRTFKSQILVLAKSRFQKFCFKSQKLNIAFVFLFLFAFLLSARAGLILGTQLQSWLWTGPRHKNVRKKDLTVFQKHYLSNTNTYIQYWKTETLLYRLIDDSPFSFVMTTFSYHEYSSKVWFVGFPDSSVGKESACKAGDLSLIPGSGRSPGEGIGFPLQYSWSSLVAQLGKNLPVMQETWARSLGWEDPMGKGKATHSSIHEYSSKVWFVEVV